MRIHRIVLITCCCILKGALNKIWLSYLHFKAYMKNIHTLAYKLLHERLRKYFSAVISICTMQINLSSNEMSIRTCKATVLIIQKRSLFRWQCCHCSSNHVVTVICLGFSLPFRTYCPHLGCYDTSNHWFYPLRTKPLVESLLTFYKFNCYELSVTFETIC